MPPGATDEGSSNPQQSWLIPRSTMSKVAVGNMVLVGGLLILLQAMSPGNTPDSPWRAPVATFTYFAIHVLTFPLSYLGEKLLGPHPFQFAQLIFVVPLNAYFWGYLFAWQKNLQKSRLTGGAATTAQRSRPDDEDPYRPPTA